MYGCALAMRPDAMEAIATMLYAEMLRYGYTHVVEFHYLHHDERGRQYANPAEMGERLIAAAANAGIKITLVPVWYQQGDFGTPPFPRQSRFICNSRDQYFRLLEASKNVIKSSRDRSKHQDDVRLGFGVHSLRAVEAGEVIATFNDGPKDIPFHLHVSEQLKEVETSLMYQHVRPAEWLLEHLPVDSRFHLVHCTHLTDAEVNKLARSGANVVLCPGTEGNLGDGIFRLSDFARAGGKWSIGTDSQISLNPLEDLRWLDYAQRLITHRRNTFDDGAQRLIHTTWQSGNRALGINSQDDYFSVGQPLDAVVYDASAPLLSGGHANQRLSSILYTADSSSILGTIVNGRWVVENGRSGDTDKIRYNYEKAMRSMVW
jgi:formimidoylglutamate deiminase